MGMIYKNSLIPLPSLLGFSYFYHKPLKQLFQHSISAYPNWRPRDVTQAGLGCWLSCLHPQHSPCLVAPTWIPELAISEAATASQAAASCGPACSRTRGLSL